MQYFDARYYRNTWGRFTTVDPLQVGAAMTDPQQWNRYAYARNNPLAYGDPSGEIAIELVAFTNWMITSGAGASVAGGVGAVVAAFGSEIWGGLKSVFGFGGGPQDGPASGIPRNGPRSRDQTTGRAQGRANTDGSTPDPGGDDTGGDTGDPTDPSDPGDPADPGPTTDPHTGEPLPPCRDAFCDVARDVWRQTGGLTEWQNYVGFYGGSASGGVFGRILFANWHRNVHAGGIEKNFHPWARQVRAGWHRLPIKPKPYPGMGRILPHYHRPPGISKHRPWEGGW